MSELAHRVVDTPIGPLTLYFTPRGIVHVAFADETPPAEYGRSRLEPAGAGVAARQLHDYFAGQLTHFTCAVDVAGTGFHRRAQKALAGIAYGETITYSELAERAGNAAAVRAAGTACARNPVPLIWPCHRVLRADRAIGNYRGGSAAKKWLLDFEAARRNRVPSGGVE